MGGIEHVKVGDYVRITDTTTHEGEVVNVRSDDTLVFIDGRWIDTEAYGNHHSVTVEVVEKPREIGWWEVEVDDPWDGLTPHTLHWDGVNWHGPKGCTVGWNHDIIEPLHYIGKGSLDE